MISNATGWISRVVYLGLYISGGHSPPCHPQILAGMIISKVIVVLTGGHLLHLMPSTASLEQAGGLNRMTLRGHTAPVRKVVISPNGRDVITVSEDGTAQVWLEIVKRGYYIRLLSKLRSLVNGLAM